MQIPTRRVDIFCACHDAAGCPSQAGQTLRFECPCSKVGGYILLRTSRVQSAPALGETGHIQNSRMPQPSVAGDILLNAPAGMVSWT